MNLLLNFVLFQLAWFACVMGAAQGVPWVGVLTVFVVALFHLLRVREPRSEMLLLAAVAAIGAVFDSLLAATGWLSYPSGQWHQALAPYWIVAMWVAFGTTLNVSLHWLKRYPLLAFVLGAIGGPLAYLGGAQLGGVTFNDPVAGLAALAMGWAVIMPALMVLASRLDGWRPGVGGRVLATVAE